MIYVTTQPMNAAEFEQLLILVKAAFEEGLLSPTLVRKFEFVGEISAGWTLKPKSNTGFFTVSY